LKRGEIWWVNLSPSIGGEIRKVRPAVIVSNDASNKFLNRVPVVPFTSNTAKVFPSEALVSVEGKVVKAVADQINMTSTLRLTKKMGELSVDDLRKVETAIKGQLDLHGTEHNNRPKLTARRVFRGAPAA
jgi:mRNA interferase MazF